MLRDLGVDTDALIYEREPKDFRYPYAFDVPLDTWCEMVVANALLRPRRVRACSRHLREHQLRAVEARAGQGRPRGDVPPAPRRALDATLSEDPRHKAELQAAIDWMFVMTLEWFGLPDDLKRHKEQLGYGLKG